MFLSITIHLECLTCGRVPGGIAGHFDKQTQFTSTMETSETNKAVSRKADDRTTINHRTFGQEIVGRDINDRQSLDQKIVAGDLGDRQIIEQKTVGRNLSDRRIIVQEDINREILGCKPVGSWKTTDGRKADDRPAVASEEEQYLKRYRHCRRLIEGDGRFVGMTDEEKDAYAQRLATPEYLDLTCDWAFKYLFQKHPELLVRLLNDILQEDIISVEFRNTELTDISPYDKRILFDLLCRTPGGTILVEMQKVSRSDQRDRLLFYGSRLVTRQVKRGDEKYVLTPVKVICIMNYEDNHPNSPEEKILYHYSLREVETAEPFGDRMSFYLLELPRIMRYTDEYDSPVAAWCRIFRNFAIFAKSRSEKDARFSKLERAMRVSGLDDKEIEDYFSDMMTEKEMRPYIEGARQQGYRKGFKAGAEQGMAEGIEKTIEKVAKSLLSLGVPVEQIGIATGLSSERIEALR